MTGSLGLRVSGKKDLLKELREVHIVNWKFPYRVRI